MRKNTRWLDLWPGFHVTDTRITNDSAWLRLEPLTTSCPCAAGNAWVLSIQYTSESRATCVSCPWRAES